MDWAAVRDGKMTNARRLLELASRLTFQARLELAQAGAPVALVEAAQRVGDAAALAGRAVAGSCAPAGARDRMTHVI